MPLPMFNFASADVRIKLLEIYATSFYSSSLWNLFSAQTQRLYTSWNQAIRQIYSVPRTTHCYFIEPLSECLHPKTMLCSRFIKFFQTLVSCRKPAVRVLGRLCEINSRTVLGSNLRNIAAECGHTRTELSPKIVKEKLEFKKVPIDEEWKIQFVKELLMIRAREVLVDNFENTEFDELIDFLCTS